MKEERESFVRWLLDEPERMFFLLMLMGVASCCVEDIVKAFK